MSVYTDITELPPIQAPGTHGALLFPWSDAYTGKLYQLYINGELVAETNYVGAAKKLLSHTPNHFVWQIVAIDPASSGTDYSSDLDMTDSQGNKVKVKWPRSAELFEIGSYVNMFGDRGSGTVSYASAFNRTPIKIFGGNMPRWGFGLSGFGNEPFGYDGEGIGFGLGSFGLGGFGFDCDYVEWISLPHPPGFYKFHPRAYDRSGNIDDGTSDVLTQFVDCLPPAPLLEIASYDDATDVLTLTVTAGTFAVPYG